jgi:hypothetical protein
MINLKEFLAKKLAEQSDAKSYQERMRYLLTLDLDQIKAVIQKDNGIVAGPYFLDEACTKANTEIKRGKQGQEIHHFKEWCEDNPRVCALSDPTTAAYYPYEWQQSEHLGYVDKLEHLLCHIKTNINRMLSLGFLIEDSVDTWMIPQLTKFYNTGEIPNMHSAEAFNRVKNYKETFQMLVDYYNDARAQFIFNQ